MRIPIDLRAILRMNLKDWGFGAPLGGRRAGNPREYRGSLTRTRCNLDVATYRAGAGMHVGKAVSNACATSLHRESFAVVLDLDESPVVSQPQAHGHMSSPRVLGGITKRFLADMEQGKRTHLGNLFEPAIGTRKLDF
jgi:hypothetical protein